MKQFDKELHKPNEQPSEFCSKL